MASLTLKLEGLEGVLNGITHGDLTGALGTLGGINNGELLSTIDAVKGLDNLDLTETVETLPVVGALCDQNEELTEQVNLLRNVIKGLGLSPALEVIGLLKIPALPTELAPFTCP